jgi:ABC-type transport system involved in multi-copper enzyme maturation permease subunit
VKLVIRYSLEEALRRRIFLIVIALTTVFLTLYSIATFAVLDRTGDFGQGAEDESASILLALAMFFILFLGVVLSVFMTMSTVRGDAERGLLQPLAVRPIGRTTYLFGRLLAAAVVAMLYVLFVYAFALMVTFMASDWAPENPVTPGLCLAGAVAIVACLSVLGSNFLGSAANGIGTFMLFGTGLTGGLLGQIGEALNDDTLNTIADAITIALPFEALYQGGLHELTRGTFGFDAIELGPFGGAVALGAPMILWALAYTALVVAGARHAFSRVDL